MAAAVPNDGGCERMTVRFDGVLAPPAATRLAARIQELQCREVVIDFSRAQRVPDVGLALLAGELLASQRAHVVLRHLGAHHERLLRYLGAGALLGAEGEPDEAGG